MAVRLFGSWASPYSTRVILALKLKGIQFEYLEEEDFSNKSPMLLQYNPVHKKIPVLVHDGRPICESMIIIEYLEETWPQHPLLPSDPNERAKARFWVKFAEDKATCIWLLFRSTGEVQAKARNDSLEMLRVLEEEGLEEGNKFFGGDKINIVDIAFGVIAHWIGPVEKVSGMKVIEDNKFPLFQAWMKNFKESPIICHNLPDSQTIIYVFRQVREKLLSRSAEN